MSTTASVTLDEYERLAEAGTLDGLRRKRVELIHGEILEMNPIGSFHGQVVSDLTEWSFDVIPRKEIAVRVQTTLRIPLLNSAPEPDLLWVRRRRYARKNPEPADVLLLVEVAESSLTADRGWKRELYAEAGIPEYWVANLIDFTIEVYRQPVGRDYSQMQTFGAGKSLSPLAVPSASLSVDFVFPE
jgi:Uma2 family endonuclease